MKYSLPARLIHWIMAGGFVFMWGCGYTMTTLVEEDSPLEETLFDLHIPVGVTLLALLIFRVAVRLAYAPPPLPDAVPGVERIGFPITKVFPTLEAWEALTETLHRWLAYTLLAVAGVHVGAVAKHRWIDRHDILHRMTWPDNPASGCPMT